MPAAVSCADETGRHPFRRERHQHRALARPGERLQVLRGGRAQGAGVVHARLLGRQERPLQVDAKHARIAIDQHRDGRDRSARLVRRIADEGGQKARRSKLAVRGRDRRDARLRRRVIEQHVAAAIDLQVDEAGREPCPVGQRADRHGRRHVRPRHDAGDMSVLDHDSGIAMHDHAVKDVVGGNRMPGRCVHRVRVIFCKCRGRSTSVPRRSARRMSRR